MNIYIGNIPHELTEDELTRMFTRYGSVAAANIVRDRYSGRSKGFGFVEMPVESEAEEAIKGLDGSMSGGRAISVHRARARAARPQRGCAS